MTSIAQKQPEIKLFPEIARASLLDRRDRELRLWLLLRHVDSGQGWVSLARAASMAAKFGITPRTFVALLRTGEGTFWHVSSTGISIRSLAKLCQHFAVLPRQPVWVPAEGFVGLANFRSHIYAAWIASHRPRGKDGVREIGPMVARATLGQLFARNRKTIWRWDRYSGIESRPNFAEAEGGVWPKETPDRRDRPPKHAFYRCWCGYQSADEVLAEDHSRKRHKAKKDEWRTDFTEMWQLPNRYFSALELAAPGQVIKIRRLLRTCFCQDAEQANGRRYFDDEGAAIRASREPRDGYRAYVRRSKQGKGGEGEWWEFKRPTIARAKLEI